MSLRKNVKGILEISYVIYSYTKYENFFAECENKDFMKISKVGNGHSVCFNKSGEKLTEFLLFSVHVLFHDFGVVSEKKYY